MAYTKQLERRLTAKYIDAFSYLDKWEDSPFKIKVLQGGIITEEGNDYDVGPTSIIKIVRMNPQHLGKAGEREFSKLTSEYFSYSGCTHEYDCCGCSSQHVVDLKKRRGRAGREYRLTLAIRYNY